MILKKLLNLINCYYVASRKYILVVCCSTVYPVILFHRMCVFLSVACLIKILNYKSKKYLVLFLLRGVLLFVPHGGFWKLDSKIIDFINNTQRKSFKYKRQINGEMAELAEGAPLLREYAVKSCIRGSNPRLTAICIRSSAG